MSNLLDDIRSLDPNDVGRWPAPFRFGAMGIIFLLAASLMIYFWAWSSNKPELDAARGQEVELLQTLEAKAKKAANLDAYKTQLEQIQRSFGTMLGKLPNKTEVPSLL